MQPVRKKVERECTHLCSKKNPSCLRKTDKGLDYGETLFRGRGQGTNATHRFFSCCYQ